MCFTLLLLNIANLTEIYSALEQIWKKEYLRATTKSFPLLQPQHGFWQNNGSELGQTQDWHPNEKMVVVPVCLNDRCCSPGCVCVVCIVTKIKAMSVCLFWLSKRCCQCNFFGIFKGRQIIPEPYKNSKYPIRCLLWWQKTLLDKIWIQVYSKPIQVSKIVYFCPNS